MRFAYRGIQSTLFRIHLVAQPVDFALGNRAGTAVKQGLGAQIIFFNQIEVCLCLIDTGGSGGKF